jgi:hypothetical protein
VTLAEFLLARIEEDEAGYRAEAAGVEWLTVNGRDLWPQLLAECEAKRRIVIEHAENRYRVDPCDAHDADGRTVPCATLLALAAVYADHSDYREEWKL